jgi:hypothetical protein
MNKKDCFGILDKVFPMGSEGLREITSECRQCPERVSCLKQALSTQEGIALREAVLDRAPMGGLMGRLNRWSQKKELSRLRKQEKKKRKLS